ncbi:MAG: SDR family NAD(P)-dependent oxidoreductase [Dehalococcoidia bacterium]
MDDLRGKNAILTGASRGLGTYIAKVLAAQGVNLALAARSAESLEEVRAACAAAGVRAIAVATDVTSIDDLRRLVDTAERELGEIDIVINNAGIEVAAPFAENSFDQIDRLLTTNVHAPMWLTKIVLPGMLARKRGVIVNVASMAGKVPNPYITTYCASKAALISFTNALSMELAGTGVHTGVVCPTFVSESGMWANAGRKAPRMASEVSPEKVARAVLKAVRGAREVLVNNGPMRPLLAAMEMAPGARGPVLRRMGILDMWREEAERRHAGEDRAPAASATPEREHSGVSGG